MLDAGLLRCTAVAHLRPVLVRPRHCCVDGGDRFLDDLDARYGGIDGVLLWGTYPNLGVDERSQFDIVEDVPGGLVALKAAVAEFNARGVKVGLPYNPWDTGTARRALRDETVLAQLAASIGAVYINGDTMSFMDENFWLDSRAAGDPLAIQPEGGPTLDSIEWTKMGWGYWSAPLIPDIDTFKWLEHRHVTQICNRWATDHTTDLQQAFFNGIGFVSWESVWGTWNGLSLRDSEATRRVGMLLRFLAPFFSAGTDAASTAWTPHTLVTPGAYAASVFASQWVLPGGGEWGAAAATAYTLVARGASNWSGPALPVPCDGGGAVYFDLYSGAAAPLAPVPTPEGGCALLLALEAGGFGAVLALAASDATPTPARLAAFLARMAEQTARALASYSATPTRLQQDMTFVAPAPLAAPPAGAVLVPGQSRWRFAVEGTEIEGRTVPGNDVQFAWEPMAATFHATHHLDVPNLFVDATPVTNAQFAAFLGASGYEPADAHNFLRDWGVDARTPPAGWGSKPVTWVDLLDARAFCAAGGKRLPNDWEWQYVASNGANYTQYPWGATFDPARVPPQDTATVRPPPPDVGSFPGGNSAAGVSDLLGLVWQWTNEFVDDHTRSGLVRGGSYYTAVGSKWYFPNNLGPKGNVRANTHNKLLLMAPAYDRHGAVGFRCVADAPGFPPPPPPQAPPGCADGSCDSFCDNAAVQGCAATLPLGVSMRAPRTGTPCGGTGGAACGAPADACAAGWAPCLSNFSSPALSSDGFRAHMTAEACSGGDVGRFIAAMSHADCAMSQREQEFHADCATGCDAAPTSTDGGCQATGCGAEAVCCGSGCVPAGCKNRMWKNATTIYDDQSHGCGNVAPSVADGVLCCNTMMAPP